MGTSTCDAIVTAVVFCILLVGSSKMVDALASTGPSASGNNCQLYDMIVIGGGSAGLTAAKLAATFGKSVVIVEEERMGGDCTWTGCVPSKAIIKSAEVAHYVRNAKKYGVDTGKDDSTEVQVDMKAVKDRVGAIIDRIYKEDDSPEAMKKLGVDTLSGRATFDTANTLKIGSKDGEVIATLEAKEGIVIATGAKPRRPTNCIPGLEDVNYITYEEVFDLDVLPKKMTVVGGGPIGCELAQTFARLGSDVTQIAKTLVPQEEPEASRILEEVFKAEGINIVKGSASSVEVDGESGHIATCTLSDGTTTTVKGDVLLVATGRSPNVKNMGLEKVGIELNERGGIQVNKTLCTAVKSIYAAGDCTGDKQFTHYAGFQGAIAARNILLPLTDPGQLDVVPATTFTSPEVGSVGLTEEQAKAEYGENKVLTAVQHLNHNDRAVTAGDEMGYIKVVYLKKKFRIVGASIVSPAAGEMISELSVAIKAKMGFDQLATVMHAYPTYSFALQVMAADVYYAKTLKTKPILDFLKRLGL